MQALAPATKKTWSATPRLNMCNKEYGLWGCGDKKILDFQRHPRFTSLREVVESFIRNYIDIPSKPPFGKGRL